MADEQGELDFARTHARRTDPQTSKDAAASMPMSAEAQLERIYWSIMRAGEPLTADEIARREGMTMEHVCRRLPELEAEGRAEPTDETRPGPTGRASRCWQLRPTR